MPGWLSDIIKSAAMEVLRDLLAPHVPAPPPDQAPRPR